MSYFNRRILSPPTIVAGLLAVSLGAGVMPTRVEASTLSAGSEDLSNLVQRVRDLVRDPDPASARRLTEMVERGLPPAAVVVLLESARKHPRQDLAELLLHLSLYRRVAIRGRALAALVALGGDPAEAAVLRGLDDVDGRVRRLAMVLTEGFSTPAIEEAVQRVRARHDREEES